LSRVPPPETYDTSHQWQEWLSKITSLVPPSPGLTRIDEAYIIPPELEEFYIHYIPDQVQGSFAGIEWKYDITDPRYVTAPPQKPLTTNHLFLNFLVDFGYEEIAAALEKKTKVPPTPSRTLREILKYKRTQCVDFSQVIMKGQGFESTYATRMKQILRAWLGIKPGQRFFVRDPTELEMTDFSSDSLKSHPGLYGRCEMRFQTKRAAFSFSKAACTIAMDAAYNGEFGMLTKHIWLVLGVVKKQSSRKHDLELRDRVAMIPEFWRMMMTYCCLSPFFDHVCNKNGTNKSSFMAHFELLNGHLHQVWKKFERYHEGVFCSADQSDHGASCQPEMMDFISDFLSEHIFYRDGTPARKLIYALGSENIFANIAIYTIRNQTNPFGVLSVFKKAAGFCDGDWGTSEQDGLATLATMAYQIVDAANKGIIRNMDDLEFASHVVMETHGDNNGWFCPTNQLTWFTPNEYMKKQMKSMGYDMKDEESLVVQTFEELALMSYKLDRICYKDPSSGRKRYFVVGWRDTPDTIKGLLYPEKMFDCDDLRIGDINFFMEVTTSLYILNYWNLEARKILEEFWLLLQHFKFHAHKLDPEAKSKYSLARLDQGPKSLGLDFSELDESWAPFYECPTPYPKERVAALWLVSPLERRNITDWVFWNLVSDEYAPHGPSMVTMNQNLRSVARLGESVILERFEQYLRDYVPFSAVGLNSLPANALFGHTSVPDVSWNGIKMNNDIMPSIYMPHLDFLMKSADVLLFAPVREEFICCLFPKARYLLIGIEIVEKAIRIVEAMPNASEKDLFIGVTVSTLLTIGIHTFFQRCQGSSGPWWKRMLKGVIPHMLWNGYIFGMNVASQFQGTPSVVPNSVLPPVDEVTSVLT